MARNDKATLVVSTGRFYTGPVGTTAPSDPKKVGVDWNDVGHTSLEDVLSFSSEGGDATTLGTLQAPQHRTKYSARTEAFAMTLQQFDEDSLKLFYGSNAKLGSSGKIQIPTNPTPTECAFYAVLEDGENTFEIYAPRCEVFRGDDFQISDTESLASLPITCKPLVHNSNDWLYEVSPLGGASSSRSE